MIRRIKTNLGVEDVDVDPCLTEEEDDGDEEDMYYECSEPISSGVEHAPELPAQLKQVEAADKCGRGEEIECEMDEGLDSLESVEMPGVPEEKEEGGGEGYGGEGHRRGTCGVSVRRSRPTRTYVIMFVVPCPVERSKAAIRFGRVARVNPGSTRIQLRTASNLWSEAMTPPERTHSPKMAIYTRSDCSENALKGTPSTDSRSDYQRMHDQYPPGPV